MVARMVGRVPCGCSCGAQYVTDSDAAKLEAVVEAGDRMRAAALCDCAGCEVVPGSCALCRAVAAYDLARKALP